MMGWQQLILRLIVLVIPKDKAKGVIGMVITLFFLPVIVLCILWNPFATTGQKDALDIAVENILQQKTTYDIAGNLKSDGCGENQYLVQEVRIYESFVVQEKYRNINNQKEYTNQIESDYFRGCQLKPKDEIENILTSNYGVSIEKYEEIEEMINEIRGMHIDLKEPLEYGKVIKNYSPNFKKVIFESTKSSNVYSSSSGKVIELKDYKDKIDIPCFKEGCEIKKFTGGKEVIVEYTSFSNLLPNGNFDEVKIRIRYCGLSNLQVEEGMMIEKNQLLGTLMGNYLIYEIQNVEGHSLDPRPYITLISEYDPTSIDDLKNIELLFPIKNSYIVSSEYDGNRVIEVDGKLIRGHSGVDLACSKGTPIYAEATGEIVAVFTDSIGGNQVVLKVGDFYFLHAHMNEKSFRRKGEKVLKGDIIGYVGTTGTSTGYHLHLEISKNGYFNGKHFNPRNIFDIK